MSASQSNPPHSPVSIMLLEVPTDSDELVEPPAFDPVTDARRAAAAFTGHYSSSSVSRFGCPGRRPAREQIPPTERTKRCTSD
jgi:hypothetical protein